MRIETYATAQHAGTWIVWAAYQLGTREAAEAFAATMPKYVRAKARSIGGCNTAESVERFGPLDEDGRGWLVEVRVELTETGSHGEINETGLKRIRKVREVHTLGDYREPYGNSLTLEELERVLYTGRGIKRDIFATEVTP